MTMQVSASKEENHDMSEDFGKKLKLNVSDEKQTAKQEEEEFSFACTNPDGSPISADELFQNGKIRPIFPIFGQNLLYCDADGDSDTDGNSKNDSNKSLRPPLRKLFMEDRLDWETSDETAEEEHAGPYCEWSSGNKTVKEASSQPCKKSNSTGFCKIWRFRELVLRSNSDGKDAFVFLNNNHHHHHHNNTSDIEKPEKYSERPEKSNEKPEKSSTSGKTTTTTTQKTSKGEKGEKVVKGTGYNKKVKAETVSSMYEKHYLRNRVMREGDKRKSYSPYRQDLVGFFTNVNGLSKNVHPF